MRNQDKTKKQLIDKLLEISNRSNEFEALENQYNQEELLPKAIDKICYYIEEMDEKLKRHTTRIKELERQRIKDEELVAKGRVAAQIAHEINEPLAAINNFFPRVEYAISKEHQHYGCVSMIKKEISIISDIVHQILELYGEEQRLSREFCVSEMIRDTVDMLKEDYRDGNIKIYIDIPETPVVVVMHEEYLADVLFEIIQNAIEASPRDGIIKIALMVSEKVLTIEVYNQGDGIPAELCPYIFEPFFTTKNGSMGLGLPISKNMVETMGGSIDFESKRGHETVFRVILPFDITGDDISYMVFQS